MKKLLIICGPTATGKTDLALHLSKVFNGEILSVDSRQVYKYLDIGTGKDKPKDIKIWGYDLITPDKEFSVKLYRDFTVKKIKEIFKRNKLPILVGGTGFYIKAVVEPLSLIEVPKNKELRAKLEKKSAEEIYSLVEQKDPKKALTINSSDRQNRRRLIRIFEILDHPNNKNDMKSLALDDILWIGLITGQRDKLYKRIDERVAKRIKLGFEKEVLFLKKKGLLNSLVRSTLGYSQWIGYLEGKLTKEEAIQKWKFAEHAYARRQLTWFKKNKNINWFDIKNHGYTKNIENLVKKWYK